MFLNYNSLLNKLRNKADETVNGRPVKYGARAGEVITGNLGRDASGKFSRVGGSASSEQRAAIAAGMKKPKRGGGKKKLSSEELFAKAESTLNAAGISKSVYDKIRSADDEPVSFDAVNDDAEAQELLKQGYLENVDGMVTASAAGNRLIRAAESGKIGKVKLMAKQRVMERKRAEREQQRGNQKKQRISLLDDRIDELKSRRDAAKNDAAKKRINARIAKLQSKRDEIAQKSTLKHMPGKHDQSTHGRRGRVGQAYNSAYRQARADGANHVDARQAAKSAAADERVKIRDEKQAERDSKRKQPAQPKQTNTTAPIEQATNIRGYTPKEIAAYIESRYKAIEDEIPRKLIDDLNEATGRAHRANADYQKAVANNRPQQEIDELRQLSEQYSNDASAAMSAWARNSEKSRSGEQYHEVTVDILSKLQHPNPARVFVNIDGTFDAVGPTARNDTIAIINGVYAMFPDGTFPPGNSVGVSHDTARAAYYPSTNRFTTHSSGVLMHDTTLHECLHAVQYNVSNYTNAPVNTTLQRWAQGRVGVEQIQPLNTILGVTMFDANEVAYRDRVDDPYTLKYYGSYAAAGGFSEVLTMAFTGLRDSHNRKDKELLQVAIEAILKQGGN
jgi:hypothetical protein